MAANKEEEAAKKKSGDMELRHQPTRSSLPSFAVSGIDIPSTMRSDDQAMVGMVQYRFIAFSDRVPSGSANSAERHHTRKVRLEILFYFENKRTLFREACDVIRRYMTIRTVHFEKFGIDLNLSTDSGDKSIQH